MSMKNILKNMKKIKESEDSQIIEKEFIKRKEKFERDIKEMKEKELGGENGEGEGEG